jgi:hypothetical protein
MFEDMLTFYAKEARALCAQASEPGRETLLKLNDELELARARRDAAISAFLAVLDLSEVEFYSQLDELGAASTSERQHREKEEGSLE